MRVKRARSGPKTEKMDPRGKSTWPELPHIGRLHACAYSTALTTGWSNRTRACPC
ncbi:5'-3' exoribonuclease 3 -like protein [Gossypium arboreum]|uniref:5'-3' exoribonuclease 3-like protein n=1 Tax=Gossypium arboreum TaxID=29729 RepID=A0A0B0ML69_GOSAR|nr:5'-3' exoribonuclease 3 -like protein [Gossypium arboreum]